MTEQNEGWMQHYKKDRPKTAMHLDRAIRAMEERLEASSAFIEASAKDQKQVLEYLNKVEQLLAETNKNNASTVCRAARLGIDLHYQKNKSELAEAVGTALMLLGDQVKAPERGWGVRQ